MMVFLQVIRMMEQFDGGIRKLNPALAILILRNILEDKKFYG